MNEQEKREKVIKGLECCASMDVNECDQCPYLGCSPDRYCFGNMAADVIVLLKAQEPRVMTLEELRDLAGNHEIVWAENNGCEHCCEGYCSPDLYYRTKEVILWVPGIEDEYEPNNALYGKSWRCWTSRPTDEQREAIPWMT